MNGPIEFGNQKRCRSSESVASSTTILDLNDECLMKIFDNFDLFELSTVAGVCSRFKLVAEECFRTSTKTSLALSDIEREYDTLQQIVGRATRILRCFGNQIVAFRETHVVLSKFNEEPKASREMYRHCIIELLARYCGESLIDLTLSTIDLTEGIPTMLLPLLERLRKLTIEKCSMSKLMLKLLPFVCGELREFSLLNISNKWTDKYHDRLFEPMVANPLYEPFCKLEKIVFHDMANLKKIDVEEILVFNPGMREIRVTSCPQISGQIMDVIVELAENVEILHIEIGYAIAYLPSPSIDFGRLKNLWSLTLRIPSVEQMVDSVWQIAAANIPLTHLELKRANIYRFNERLLDGIVRMDALQSLKLTDVNGLLEPQILEICEKCTSLEQLSLETGYNWKSSAILRVVENARKLKLLNIRGVHTFGLIPIHANLCPDLIRTVADRDNGQNHLKIILSSPPYRTSSIPWALADPNSNVSVTIEFEATAPSNPFTRIHV